MNAQQYITIAEELRGSVIKESFKKQRFEMHKRGSYVLKSKFRLRLKKPKEGFDKSAKNNHPNI